MEQGAATASVGLDELEQAPFETLPAGHIVRGRYEIRSVLGVGGYSAVYLAYDRDLHSEVALKILRRDRSSPAALARFRREVSVAREAVSPRLVRVFDLDTAAEGLYLTMEVMRGGSLRQCLTNGAPPVQAVIRIATEILEGLSALHTLNIVHRDLKPENILFGEDGHLKLGDFGLARYLDDEHSRATATGAIVGTADYLSPEQALGRETDRRSDLYSLGIVLYEMLTGDPPFERRSSLGSVLARVRSNPPSVRKKRHDVPFWFSTIVDRLLERDLRRRYKSADDVLAAIHSKKPDLRFVVSLPRVATAALVVFAAISVSLLSSRGQSGMRFARLSAIGDSGVQAVGRHGEVLWRIPGADPDIATHYALARIDRTHRPLIATILGRPAGYSPARMETLSFLDPETGSVVRRARIPSAAGAFPGSSRRFQVGSIQAVDVNGDGIDEVVISFVHLPEAPSYVVLYEPLIDRGRVIFEGIGHHRYAGLHDIDGDGKPEIFLLGINNGFDWVNVLTAIHIQPGVNEVYDAALPTVQSPDWGPEANAAWYTLLPRGGLPSTPKALSFDDAHRRITIHFPGGKRVVVTMDGFLAADTSGLPVAERLALRRGAYAHYRESRRLLSGGFNSDAIREVSAAVESAKRDAEPLLIEVMQRALGQELIAAGRVTEGEKLLASIAATSENASEVAYELAVSLHLRGELQKAVKWYERGLGKGATVEAGKSKHEFLQGIVLALSELGRWHEALTMVDRVQREYGTSAPWTDQYREFIRWRMGEKPRVDKIVVTFNSTDLTRYWVLEFRAARGENSDELLRRVNEEIAVGAGPQSGLWSLKAELLWKKGQTVEAADAARQAWQIAQADRTSSIIARAHLPIIRERLERIALHRGKK